MYQSPRQHTEDARRVLGDDVLMAIPATRTRSWAVFNMDRWHPPLLVFYAERVDVHLGRFVRTGPGHLLSTTPLAEVSAQYSEQGHPSLTTSDNTWHVSPWHDEEFRRVLAELDHPGAPEVV